VECCAAVLGVDGSAAETDCILAADGVASGGAGTATGSVFAEVAGCAVVACGSSAVAGSKAADWGSSVVVVSAVVGRRLFPSIGGVLAGKSGIPVAEGAVAGRARTPIVDAGTEPPSRSGAVSGSERVLPPPVGRGPASPANEVEPLGAVERVAAREAGVTTPAAAAR
jgi:hypothetical protein